MVSVRPGSCFHILLTTDQVGPIIAGPMASTVGWRNFWWLNVAVLGFTLIITVFGFPETKWHRPHPDQLSSEQNGSSMAKSPVHVENQEKTTEKVGELNEINGTMSSESHRFVGKGKPSKQQFRLFQPTATPLKDLFIAFWTPWKLFAFPIVEFACFGVSWTASSFLTLNLTQSQAFAAPPYNYSSQTIGSYCPA